VAGERVSDHPRLTVRVPRRVVDLLEQMAANEERPQWKVLADAIGERADRVLKYHRRVTSDARPLTLDRFDRPTEWRLVVTSDKVDHWATLGKRAHGG
jgi:hypothetical protein